jgi:hypothetical protein
MSSRTGGLAAGGLVPRAGVLVAGQGARSADAQVIELTRTGWPFLESENGVDQGFAPRSAADCNRIDAGTGNRRLAAAETLALEPGTGTFGVSNTDVPYELGLRLREAADRLGNPVHKPTGTSVSGGGLLTGQPRDDEVEVEPGAYVHSCPLDPTPDYKIVVRG